MPGRCVGAGWASESFVGAGEADASGVSSTVAAGMSSAVSWSRLATANGPDPTGWWPNGAAARSVIGTSASRCAGAIGWVAAWRNPPRGVASVNTTVRESTVWTATSFHDPAPGPV